MVGWFRKIGGLRPTRRVFLKPSLPIRRRSPAGRSSSGALEEVIPWTQLLAVTEPFYPKGERGRSPVGLERMLRVYFPSIRLVAILLRLVFDTSALQASLRSGDVARCTPSF